MFARNAGKGTAPTPDQGACSGGAHGSHRLEGMCYEVAVQGRRLGAAGGPGKRGHRLGRLDPSKKHKSRAEWGVARHQANPMQLACLPQSAVQTSSPPTYEGSKLLRTSPANCGNGAC